MTQNVDLGSAHPHTIRETKARVRLALMRRGQTNFKEHDGLGHPETQWETGDGKPVSRRTAMNNFSL